MKKKLLVFAPLMALMVSGCFARLPTNSSGKAPTTSSTSGSGGGSDSSSSSSSEEPGDLDFGSEGHELSLAQALDLFNKIVEYDEDSGKYSTYTEKAVYVKAKVTSDSTSQAGVKYVNLKDGNLELTVYDAIVPEEYKGSHKMEGKTAYVYGYATKFVKDDKLTYELTYKSKDDASSKATVYKVEDPEPTPGADYGTLDDPLTIAEAYSLLDTESPTAKTMYVTGKVVSNDAYNSKYHNIGDKIVITDGSKEFTLYRCNSFPSTSTIDISTVVENDPRLVDTNIVASGTGKIFKDTYELDSGCKVEKIEEKAVPVTGISVNPTSLTLENNGATGSFAVVVSPDNATNKDFSVVSSKTNVATVEKNGSNVTVTPLVAGSSTVTVTSADNPQFTAKCEVTVNTVDATGVTVSPKTETLVTGGQPKTLTATVAPANATNKTVTWSSNAVSIVSVDPNTGVITPGSSAGEAIITATDHKGHTDSCTVTVTSTVVHVSSVEIESAYKTLVLQANGSASAALSEHVTVLPTEALDKSLTFSSSNTDVATVDSSTGVVTPHAPGSATITVTSVDNPDATDTCAVTVNKIPVSSVTLDKHELALNVDGTETLTATVNPDNATYKGVSWKSSNPSVATVSNGVVTAKAEGTATITVKSTDDTSKTDTCAVTVSVPVANTVEVAYKAAKDGGTEDSYEFTGTIIGVQGNTFFVQDGEYGICVYGSSKDWLSGITDTKVTVNATMQLYNGLVETKTISSVVGAGQGDTITPLAVNSLTDITSAKQNVLANVATATFVTKDKTWSTSNDCKVTFTIGGDNVTTFFSKRIASDASTVNAINSAVEGQVFTLTNFVSSVNYSNPQLVYTTSSVVTKQEVPATGISFASSNYEVPQGGQKDMSKEITLTPSTATSAVTYTVSGNSGVSINPTSGLLKVTSDAPTANKATVVATANGHSANTQITVTSDTPVVDTSKVDFSDKDNLTASSVNNYNSVCDITYSGKNWTTYGGNNNGNNASWTYMKFGHKTNATTAFIETEFVATGSTITISFVGIDELDRTDLSKISSIKVYASSEAFGKKACTDSSKLIHTVASGDMPTAKPATQLEYAMSISSGFSGYIQVVMEIPAVGGNNNGLISIRAVTIS